MKHLHSSFFLSLVLFFYGQSYGQFSQIGSDIDGEAAGDKSGHSVSLSANGNILAIGAGGNDGNGTDAGQVRIYERIGTTWTQKGNDIDGEAANDYSGSSVSLSANGNILAIGAYGNDGSGTDAGHVRIYEWTGTAWTQKGNDIDGEVAGDWSGSAVSLSDNGNILAVGAPYNDDNGTDAGQVRIYEWTGTAWAQKGSDINGGVLGSSGSAVSLSANGNILAIGAYGDGGSGPAAGHVRIYEWTGTAWIQKGNDIDGEAAGDWSGFSVSLSANGNILAVGEPMYLGTGSVRVYEWTGTAWVQKGINIDGDHSISGFFGFSVSLSDNGNILAIGAPNSGRARIYGWDGNTWIQKGYDLAEETASDFFGKVNLSANGSILAIGAPNNDGNGINAGHVRVYKINGIYSYTYQKFSDSTCIRNSAPGLPNRILTLNPGNIVIPTNGVGNWYIDSLPIGNYTLTADTSSPNLQLICPVTQSFAVTNTDSSFFAPSFGYIFNTLNTDKQSLTTISQIKIYPNPTTGILNIDQGNSQEISISIFDNLGRAVLQKQSNETISSLNINNLPAGIYYISIKNETAFITKKLIKQ